jgi:translation initiation factor 2B subunit (eIF-2B alpha/beta/delta family)
LFVPLVFVFVCAACVLWLQVVVPEAAPGYDGHAMASQLSQAKVQTTLIADSAVFAMMARVNKVGRYCG